MYEFMAACALQQPNYGWCTSNQSYMGEQKEKKSEQKKGNQSYMYM